MDEPMMSNSRNMRIEIAGLKTSAFRVPKATAIHALSEVDTPSQFELLAFPFSMDLKESSSLTDITATV
jgi:hypothetical protein